MLALLSLLWWILVIGASIQAFRAWGGAAAIGTFVTMLLVSWVPFGGLITTAAAIFVGYQAENEMDRKQLTG